MDYQKDIDNFTKVISKDKDIDLKKFYKNLKTLKIKLEETNSHFNMGYDITRNEIVFLNEEIYEESINHELFHLASSKKSKKIFYSGFYIWNEETKLCAGIGINEGYTESLQQRYFNKGKGYPVQTFYINQLEKIIDPIILKKAYFENDLNKVIKELNKYESLENIDKFMKNLNIYTVALSNNQKYSFKQIQDAITYCSCFLASAYVNKITKENPKNIVDKVFDYFGDFDKKVLFEKYPIINIEVPLEEGTKILEKSGFRHI